MKISVVIPNYNGAKLLEKNLPKVIESVKNTEIIVVDDSSTDNSVTVLNEKFANIKLITNEKNLGFSSTVNKGVNEASGELIVLLNTDVYPQKGFLDSVIPHFSDPDVFAVGLLQNSLEDGKTILRGRGVGKFQKGFLIHSRGEVDKTDTLWVSGGGGVFLKKIWERLGGLCELYNPFYWEDLDLSYRAVKAGYTILFEPKSIVIHEQSTSAIRNKYSPSEVKTIAYRNQFFFIWLNISDRHYIIQHFLYLPIHFIKALMSLDLDFIKGFFLAIFSFPKLLSARFRNLKMWVKSDKDII